MANSEPKDYPLLIAEDAQFVLDSLRAKVSDNSDIVQLVNTSYKIYINDIKKPSFYFYINEFKMGLSDKPVFESVYSPFEKKSLNSSKGDFYSNDVLTFFDKWLDLIKLYNKTYFTEQEKFSKIFEAEIIESLQILDSDANEIPFDDSAIIVMYSFMDSLSNFLDKDVVNPIFIEIASESRLLRDNVQNYTKKKVIHQLAIILGKIKVADFLLYAHVYSVMNECLLKEIFNKGVKNIKEMIQDFTSFFLK